MAPAITEEKEMIVQAETTQSEILPLTGLRFVAALYVFIFHIDLRWPLAPALPFLSNVLGQGAVGMSLFFVLSGYVLAMRYGDGRGNYRDYLVNRFSRIYPVYALVALLTLPWIGISLSADTGYMVVRQAVAIVTLILANIFLLQAWFPSLFSLWNIGGSWSIAVEAFCYALLPLILRQLYCLANRQIAAVAFGAYICTVLPGLILVLFGGEWQLFYSLPIFRLPEFIVGVCVCFAVQRSRVAPRLATTLQLVAMLVLVAYLGLVGNRFPGWISHNWLVIPVIAVTIFCVAQSWGLVSRVLSTAPLVWLGKISYSFYSFQLLVLLLLKSYYSQLVVQIPALGNNVVLLAASFLVLVLMSAAGYHFIEEPARRWIKGTYSRVRGVKTSVAGAPQARSA